MRAASVIKQATLLLGIFGALSASAHDFWLQPDQYWSQPNVAVPITLQVGHGPDQQRSQIRTSRIARFMALTPQGSAIDLRANLHLRGQSEDGRLQFPDPGTYVVVFETDNAGRSALVATRFNQYIKAEGLTAALEQRERAGQMTAPASESYRRVSKALVHVGTVDVQSSSQVTRAVGLPLEIVPERNPYTAQPGADLPVQVIFEGRPLAGALVKLTQLEHGDAAHEIQRTDQAGRASFELPRSGTWLLNVVWTKPATTPAEVDFETTFSSLSFGFPPEPVSDRSTP
jgi:uncharacterized GH25 family protein